MTTVLSALTFSFLTIIIFQLCALLQSKTRKIWLNPMLLSICLIISILFFLSIDYDIYRNATISLSWLLEPAVVALGYPLYQHLPTMKRQWKKISLLLGVGASFVIIISYISTKLVTNDDALSVSIALKSITTPIGLALTEQLHGNQAITAFAIILAGLFGAIFGISWLNTLGISSRKAQGLAIGAASHALGTATISQLSFQHAAYGSLALIVSATFTALLSPFIITQLGYLF